MIFIDSKSFHDVVSRRTSWFVVVVVVVVVVVQDLVAFIDSLPMLLPPHKLTAGRDIVGFCYPSHDRICSPLAKPTQS